MSDKRKIAVFAIALTCMTTSARQNSTYLDMIDMLQRRPARKVLFINQPQFTIKAFQMMIK